MLRRLSPISVLKTEKDEFKWLKHSRGTPLRSLCITTIRSAVLAAKFLAITALQGPAISPSAKTAQNSTAKASELRALLDPLWQERHLPVRTYRELVNYRVVTPKLEDP